jgi:hypothetical protein
MRFGKRDVLCRWMPPLLQQFFGGFGKIDEIETCYGFC